MCGIALKPKQTTETEKPKNIIDEQTMSSDEGRILSVKFVGKFDDELSLVIGSKSSIMSGEPNVIVDSPIEVKGLKNGGKLVFKFDPKALDGINFSDITFFMTSDIDSTNYQPIEYTSLKFDKEKHTVTLPINGNGVYIPVDRAAYKAAMEDIIKTYEAHQNRETEYGELSKDTDYKNEEYGFSMTFPKGWEYFPVKYSDYKENTLGFMEKNIVVENVPEDHDAVSVSLTLQRYPTSSEQSQMNSVAEDKTAGGNAQSYYESQNKTGVDMTLGKIDIGKGKKGYIVTKRYKDKKYTSIKAFYEYSDDEFIMAGFSANNEEDIKQIKSSAKSFALEAKD